MDGARLAEAGDANRLAALARLAIDELEPLRGGSVFVNRETRREPLEESFVTQLDDEKTVVVVGTIDDVALGYGTGHVELLADGRLLGIIDDLFVEAEGRGIGVGFQMMTLLLDWFREQGCAGVDAPALPGARETKNFFEGSGFSARLLVMHHRFPDPSA